ncbi:zinc transporter [Acrasis kona]|uniref:Zinc transporter n=1 Tax=Acrasis kona TaxID=1008807 RepID=A0AAW2ZDC5_9EUKA
MFSHSLVIIFCAFYTLHRALHYIIMVTGHILEKKVELNRSLFTAYSYGYRRAEVVLRFSNSIFAAFISFAFITEGIQRLAEPHHYHMEYITMIALVGVLVNFFGVYLFSPTSGVINRKGTASTTPYSYKNFSLPSVSGSNNTWQELILNIQNHLKKQRQFIYEWIVESHAHIAAFVTALFISTIGDYLDVVIAFIMSILTFTLALPPIVEASSTLLQTTPDSVMVQLSRCVNESSKLEDVLECYGEHFWTVGPASSASSKTHVIGSMQVRVVEGANEQTVLRNVQRVFADKKSFSIDLTIQIEKRTLRESSNSSLSSPSNVPISQSNTSTSLQVNRSTPPQQPLAAAVTDTTKPEPTTNTTATPVIINQPIDASHEGLGLYIEEQESQSDDEDDMFRKLKKTGSATNLMNRNMNKVPSTHTIMDLDRELDLLDKNV